MTLYVAQQLLQQVQEDIGCGKRETCTSAKVRRLEVSGGSRRDIKGLRSSRKNKRIQAGSPCVLIT